MESGIYLPTPGTSEIFQWEPCLLSFGKQLGISLLLRLPVLSPLPAILEYSLRGRWTRSLHRCGKHLVEQPKKDSFEVTVWKVQPVTMGRHGRRGCLLGGLGTGTVALALLPSFTLLRIQPTYFWSRFFPFQAQLIPSGNLPSQTHSEARLTHPLGDLKYNKMKMKIDHTALPPSWLERSFQTHLVWGRKGNNFHPYLREKEKGFKKIYDWMFCRQTEGVHLSPFFCGGEYN